MRNDKQTHPCSPRKWSVPLLRLPAAIRLSLTRSGRATFPANRVLLELSSLLLAAWSGGATCKLHAVVVLFQNATPTTHHQLMELDRFLGREKTNADEATSGKCICFR